jgi:putative ABC transport system permease protein
MGLGIGLAAFTFILLYIIDELSFDKHHKYHQQIYRLESDITISGRQQYVSKSSYAIGPAMLREFPQVKNFVRFRQVDHCYLNYKDKKFYEDGFYYCDSSVFELFTHSFISGNPATALTEPYSMVLTESIAEKYLGTTNASGQTILLKGNVPCIVTAVIRDVPANSHLTFSGLVSMPTIREELGVAMYDDLNNIHFWAIRLFTYIRLKKGTTIESIHEQFPAFHDKYIAAISDQLNGVFKLMTTRLDRIHLSNNAEWDLPKGSIQTVYVLYAIAVFILLIAAINYMNLATARSANKAREVGMRKVLGADRPQLARFFISDAVFLSVLALVVAIVIVELFLPAFNAIIGKHLTFDLIKDTRVYGALFLTTLIIGFISGVYPAYYLASFQPQGILSKKRILGPTDGLLRKALIILQFTIATAMIAGSIIVKLQVDFIHKRNLGFDKKNLLVIRATDSTFKKRIDVFKQKLETDPNILGVSTSNTLPGLGNYLDVFTVEGSQGLEQSLISLMFVGEDFLDVLGMKVIQGRNFYKNNITDKREAAIINKSAAKKLGWENNALGKRIYRNGYERGNFAVIGVVDDLVYASLYEKIGPIVFFLEESPEDLISIRIKNENRDATIDRIQAAWTSLNPNEPFKYDFLEDRLNDLYINEFKLYKVIVLFAMLALFISLLGLYGLTSYITEKSSKNIGIRKLLGARVSGIVFQFSKKFSRLIIIALVIATPVTWIALDRWLDHFAYRITLQVSWFILAWLIVLAVAQLTVVSQTIKAALTNPAEVIRYE